VWRLVGHILLVEPEILAAIRAYSAAGVNGTARSKPPPPFCDIYDKDTYVDRISGLLNDIESRQTGDGTPLGFRPVLAAAE